MHTYIHKHIHTDTHIHTVLNNDWFIFIEKVMRSVDYDLIVLTRERGGDDKQEVN